MTLQTTPRPRKCEVKTCRQTFKPYTSFITWCSPECGVVVAGQRMKKKAEQEAKRQRIELKAAREKLRTRSYWLKLAQAVFNKWVRMRDEDEGCISCGARGRECWDAGHYRSVGAAPQLRFHEDNCHKQCVPCNQFKSGNAIEFRRGLLGRIGEERLARLEASNTPAKHTIEDAKEIIKTYRAKLKDAKAAARHAAIEGGAG